MKDKKIDSSEEVAEIKVIKQDELLSDLAKKLNVDEGHMLEELARIIKGKISE